jgi:two-component system nitrogen regulation response regulator GlnG
MIARVLESAGYVAVLAGAGSEAVTAVRDVRPDLLLLDLNAPGSQGWDVLDQIHRSYPDLPIVLITGWPNLSAQAAQRGIGHLMEKPLDLPVLLDLIQHLVARSPRATRQQQEAEPSSGAIFAPGLSVAASGR